MLDSFVLRLVARELPAGRIAGEVEVVRTGTRVAVTCLEDLLDVLAGRTPGSNPTEEMAR